MASIEELLLIAAALLFAGVLASKASARLGVPALLFFLAIGMLACSDGPGGIWRCSARSYHRPTQPPSSPSCAGIGWN